MTELLLENAPCGCFVFSDNGTVTEINNTVCVDLGVARDQIVNRNIEEIFTISTRIFYQTHFFPLLKMSGHVEEIYMTLLKSDGEHLPILLSAKRVEAGGEMLNSCAYITVHNRKKFEDELVAARNAAQRALSENTELVKVKSELQGQADELQKQMVKVESQNHELQQFNHVITHNLKEPLRKIQIFTGKLNDQTQSRDMERLDRSVKQMRAVVTGLQEYIWLNEKTNAFSRVDLKLSVQAAMERLKFESNSAALHISYDELPEIAGDQEQLALLFYHLFSNSIKFRRLDRVEIQIHSTLLKQNRFTSVEGKYDYVDFVKLEVVDNGIGFESQYASTIFELFKKSHYLEGQGLGLALCKKIAINHGGMISAESVVNSYTKIIIWLPIAQLGTKDARRG
jgi:sigma-B regulation protein RsbU (phosphoserine phosphatase)